MDKDRAARMLLSTLPADGVSEVKVSAKPPAGAFRPPPRVDEYRLEKPIGRGAMGAIFLAHDTVLDRSVAVKFIAAQSSKQARERFLIEARAIARLHHPNVVAIFRVGEVEGHPYLVSEFVDGQSLDKLAKPLPWAEVLRIALGLVSGLAAAHKQGVLHRDIKAANVMRAVDGTVKLLDFGLAKLSGGAAVEAPPAAPPALASRRALTADDVDAAPNSQNLTAVGAIIGTPSYMAPEAWFGEPATERSDIYSLGALLYELCTGRTPHYDEDVLQICRSATVSDAAPLLRVKPDVHPGLASVIDRCVRREPAERYASASDLLQALSGVSQALTAPTLGGVLRREIRQRWPLSLLMAALLVGAPVAVLYPLLSRSDGAPSAPVSISNPRRAVAVLGVTADSAPQAASAAVIAELLSDELSAGEKLRRIPADTVTRMRIELALSINDPLGPDMMARIHRYAGADLVVTGALSTEPSGELTVRAAARECKSGKEVASASARGRAGDIFQVIESLGAELRRKLGVGELSEREVGELRASRPSSPEVAALFAEGQERLRRFDLVAARDALTRAVSEDPDFALGHFALAGVWSALGHDARAREATTRALREARHLAREPRILIEARHRELNKEWEQAIALYRSLTAFFPDSLDYGLYLAEAQIAAGQIAAALSTVNQLRLLPAPAREDPRINIAKARATIAQADYAAALSLLKESVQQGEAMNAPLLVARARLEMAYVYQALGQYKDALERAAQAQKAYSPAGDQAAVADALMLQGLAHGFLGQLDASADMFSQALSRLLDIENNALVAIVMSNMALMLIRQGKFELALARAEAGLTWGRELDSKESAGAAEVVIGWIAALRGQLGAARKHFTKADTAFALLGDPRLIAWVDWHNGQLLAAEGRLAEAAERHERALAIRERHDLKGFAAESRVALAELSLERGEPAAAADLARQAAQRFHQDGRGDSEALALALLGQALTALGRSQEPEAREAIARAAAVVRVTQDALVRVQVSRILAELSLGDGRKGDAARAEAALLSARAEARSIGLALEALRIDIALCRALAALGREEEAAALGAASAREARERGFLSIAAKASDASLAKSEMGSAHGRNKPIAKEP